MQNKLSSGSIGLVVVVIDVVIMVIGVLLHIM